MGPDKLALVPAEGWASYENVKLEVRNYVGLECCEGNLVGFAANL